MLALVFVEYLPPSSQHPWLRHSPWHGVRGARSWWFVLGLAAAAAAAWVAWEPNKRASTPSFTLLMAATFALSLRALRGVHLPVLDSVGRNALLVYVGQHVVRELVGDGPDEHLLLYAATATIAWALAAVVLGRLKIRLVV